ncbi:MAG: GntR family transcriptional regulator [Actinobacteria bacterium]|jgi:DNA-binding GntR family transcriptional regulator|nr:GntR family transcriptional regulator [Actinomycetota bacterium]
MRLDPVVQQSTPMMIAARVREAIAQGDFAPGAQLFEAELARQLGVSRGPLREGLQRLTQEGLLVSIRNRGLFVVHLTADDVRDMYLARGAIERGAAAVVVARDPVGTADALEPVLEQMAQAAEAGDSRGVADADIRFHEVLVARSGSARLARVHATQVTEARICIQALGSTHSTDEVRLAEHRRIADALRAGDADLVDSLLARHMADAVADLVELSETSPLPETSPESASRH